MKTHLLRSLIKHDLDPGKDTLSQAEITTWKLIIPDVNNDLLGQLDFLYNCPFDRQLLKNAVQGIQSECINLLNSADKLNGLAPENQTLLDEAKKALHNLLHIIDEKYADFAAQDIFMANSSFLQSMGGIMQDYKSHANAFSDRKLDPELQQVILYPIKDMSERRRCTYGKINYVIRLQEEISTLLEIAEGDVTNELLDLLLSKNFNTDGFLAYYVKKIERELEEALNDTGRHWLLKKYERRFKNPPYRKKKIFFDVTKRSASSFLLTFIEDRMHEKPALQPRVKIHSMLSVDPLSYFFRLMVDSNVLKPEGKKEFCELLAGIFTTSNTGKRDISSHSFYAKYRSPTRASRRAVKQVLNRMIKLIDQEEES